MGDLTALVLIPGPDMLNTPRFHNLLATLGSNGKMQAEACRPLQAFRICHRYQKYLKLSPDDLEYRVREEFGKDSMARLAFACPDIRELGFKMGELGHVFALTVTSSALQTTRTSHASSVSSCLSSPTPVSCNACRPSSHTGGRCCTP